MKILNAIAMVLASLSLSTVIPGCGQATDTKSPAAAIEVFSPTHPTGMQAFQAAYKTTNSSGKHTIDAKRVASLWVSKEMTDGDNALFVVLVQQQQLDETGALEDCHACAATLHAITFTKTEKGWSSGNFQQNIAEIGGWGKAPEIATVDFLVLSPGNALLLLPEEYQGMGVSQQVLKLLNHVQGKWSDAGHVSIGGDNHGEECSNEGDPSDPNHCYSFTGTLSKSNGKSVTHPDLVVIKSGTEYDTVKSAVVLAKTEVYQFKGSGYVSAKQKREKDEAGQNVGMAQELHLTSTPTSLPVLVATTTKSTSKVSVNSAAAKAPEDTESTLDRAIRKLNYCVMPHAQYGQYSSFDGGKSAGNILIKDCGDEYLAYEVACKATGAQRDQCLLSAAATTQLVLKSFNK